MGLQLTFEIELHSDYHVSAGHGLGALVDSALHRDADGLPVLRGTTLTGLLRDGLYQLLRLAPLRGDKPPACQASGLAQADAHPRFCGQHDAAQPDCPVCAIFGSPRTIRHWRIGSARPIGLPLPVGPKADWQPGKTGGQIAPHVRVSPRTRRAEARKLFFREEGDGRLRFRFTVTCDRDDAAALGEAAWLVAAARTVRRLGAGRRRGRGACCIHLVNDGTAGECLPTPAAGQTYEEVLLSRFERQHLDRQELTSPDLKPGAFVLSQAAGGDPLHLLVIARLDEPLLVSTKAEAGNEFRTVDLIPGSAVRGALAGRAATRHSLQETDGDAYAAFVRLFFRDALRFSPLYPTHRVSNDVYPTLPAPLDVLSCGVYPGFAETDTATAHGAKSFALNHDLDPECPRCRREYQKKVDLKPLSGFLSLQPKPQEEVKIHYLTEMHVHIDPATGRAAGGDLYSFHALAPGQYFLGELSCADAAAWEDVCRLAGLPHPEGFLTLRLGKANRRGYGQVTLWIRPRPADQEHPWYTSSLTQRVANPQTGLVMTLLTDAILPDRWGRFLTGLDAAWLSALLGVKVTIKRSFCASRGVDAFNAHLGLPRWRDVALCAGSSVGIEFTEALPDDQRAQLLARLAVLEREGIGLRRNEGFGQIAFNHPLSDPQYAGCGAVAVDNNPIRLPELLRPATAGKHHVLVIETTFRQTWENFLTENRRQYQDTKKPDPFGRPEFEALARQLLTAAPMTVQGVKDLVGRLGHPEVLLPGATLQELTVWKAAKGQQNFFDPVMGKGKTGLQALDQLLAALSEEVQTRAQEVAEADSAAVRSRCWRVGLELLADRIAAAARASAEERGQ